MTDDPELFPHIDLESLRERLIAIRKSIIRYRRQADGSARCVRRHLLELCRVELIRLANLEDLLDTLEEVQNSTFTEVDENS